MKIMVILTTNQLAITTLRESEMRTARVGYFQATYSETASTRFHRTVDKEPFSLNGHVLTKRNKESGGV